jgi:glycopeptide antibiotics resistance protein
MSRSMGAWLTVILVILALSWLALGHGGVVETTGNSIRLIPFEEYVEKFACIVNDCPNAAVSRAFLLINGLGNMVVFAPLGASLYVALSNMQKTGRASKILFATALGIAVSTIFEIAQFWIPGRVVASDDVILNTIGTALGAVAASLFSPYASAQTHIVMDQDDGSTP